MKRVGILGGTFDPVHIGHLVIAQSALEQLGLDHVIFVPSHHPPHKRRKQQVDVLDRFEMVRLAIDGHPKFVISDFELNHNRTSYSYLTVEHFMESYPKQTGFFFIMGEDCYDGVEGWKNFDQLRSRVTFAVANRPGVKVKADQPRCKVRYVQSVALDISSSLIRKKIQLGQSIQYLVPERVFRYIQDRNLYC